MIRDRIAARSSASRQSPERLDTRGAVDIQNVDQALVRPDLGFKMTNEDYKQYQSEEQQFNASYDATMSSNTDAITKNKAALTQNQALLNQINEAQAGVETKSIEPLWAEAQKSFVPVVVTAGLPITGAREVSSDTPGAVRGAGSHSDKWYVETTNPEVQYTKYYPKAVIDALDQGFNKKGSFQGKWVDGAYYVGDAPLGAGGSRYGKELNDLLTDAETKTKTAFWEQAAPAVDAYNATAVKAVGDYQTKKDEVQKYIDSTNESIGQSESYMDVADKAKETRGAQKDAYKQQYEQSVSQRQALFR